MLEIIKNWLAKPSGRYFDGLAIFLQLAPKNILDKYAAFFSELKKEPKQGDIHFSILINKIADIERKVALNPKAFEHIQLFIKEAGPDQETILLIAEAETKIAELKQSVEDLEDKKTDVDDENSDLQLRVDELEAEIEGRENELAEIKAKRGIQIVKYDTMPEDIQAAYDRNREITPLMAKLHAEASVEKLNHKTREKLVAQLLKLDDERRANWDLIDDWSQGKETETPIVKEALVYSNDKVIAGAQMARRVEALKENIARSTKTAENAEREVIKENALKRVEAYKAELEELLKLITPAEEKGSDVEK
jgi:ribosomal silencing factor RsfS